MSTTVSSQLEPATGEPCPECGEPAIRTANEAVCSDCNVVIDDTPIDYGPEWRAFDQRESWQRARTGPPVSGGRHDDGLPTRISSADRDGHGVPLSSTQRRRYDRLRRLNRWFVECGEGERSLRDGLIQLRKLGSDLGAPQSAIARAQMLFRTAVGDGLLEHYGIDRTVAAVVFAACKLEEVAIRPDEVTVVAHASRREILRTYRFLRRELGLEIPPSEAVEAVPAICSELELRQEVERKARSTLEAYRRDNPGAGTFPSTLAATAVYTVCRHDRRVPTVTQSEVGDAAGVNPCTISTYHDDLREYINP